MKLPDSLAGWAPYIELFPKEVGAALLPIVRRLAAGIGPLHSENTAGAGEPDGFNGLHRAGSYERLLLSEWLLAEEAPDEFLRRAAMAEHTFLRLARREPSRARISLALFDAGPSQMGAPRIAQLAALLVLARRAEAAGADFRWAVLQDRDEGFTPTVDAAGVWRFLQSRTALEVGGWSLGWWLRNVDRDEYRDVWLIGGSRLANLPDAHEFCRLEITDPLEDLEERLELSIHLRGRAPRLLSLPLPSAGECTRLLRDPFGAVAREAIRAGDSSLAPTSNLIFTQGGGRLISRSSGGVVTHHVPNSPRAGQGQPHVARVPEGWTCVAAGRMRKTLIYALLNGEERRLRLQRIGGKTERMLNREFEVALPPQWNRRLHEDDPLPLGEIAVDPFSHIAQPALLIRVGATLLKVSPYALPHDEMAKRAAVLREGVLALTTERYNVNYLVHDTQGALVYTAKEDGAHEWERLGPFRPDPAMFIGWRANYGNREGWWVAAVAGPRREWRIAGPGGLDRTLVAPETSQVVGVIGAPQMGRQPGLVQLDSSKRRLSIMGPDWSQELPPAPEEIRQVTVAQSGPVIAYATASGDLTVWRCDQRAAVFRLATSGRGEP